MPGSPDFNPADHYFDGTNWWTLDKQWRFMRGQWESVEANVGTLPRSSNRRWIIGCVIAALVALVLAIGLMLALANSGVFWPDG